MIGISDEDAAQRAVIVRPGRTNEPLVSSDLKCRGWKEYNPDMIVNKSTQTKLFLSSSLLALTVILIAVGGISVLSAKKSNPTPAPFALSVSPTPTPPETSPSSVPAPSPTPIPPASKRPISSPTPTPIPTYPVYINGTVYRDQNCNGNKDSNESTVLSGVTVRIYKTPEYSLLATISTGSDGQFHWTTDVKDTETLGVEALAESPPGYKVYPKAGSRGILLKKTYQTVEYLLPQVPNESVGVCF